MVTSEGAKPAVKMGLKKIILNLSDPWAEIDAMKEELTAHLTDQGVDLSGYECVTRYKEVLAGLYCGYVVYAELEDITPWH